MRDQQFGLNKLEERITKKQQQIKPATKLSNWNMGNSMPTTYNPNGAFNESRTSTLGGRSSKSKKSDSAAPESSRVLFLLYLIHRTWNIMVESVDLKNKKYVFGFNKNFTKRTKKKRMKEERAVQTTIFKMIYKTNSYAIAHAPSFILTMNRFILMM